MTGAKRSVDQQNLWALTVVGARFIAPGRTQLRPYRIVRHSLSGFFGDFPGRTFFQSELSGLTEQNAFQPWRNKPGKTLDMSFHAAKAFFVPGVMLQNDVGIGGIKDVIQNE